MYGYIYMRICIYHKNGGEKVRHFNVIEISKKMYHEIVENKNTNIQLKLYCVQEEILLMQLDL